MEEAENIEGKSGEGSCCRPAPRLLHVLVLAGVPLSTGPRRALVVDIEEQSHSLVEARGNRPSALDTVDIELVVVFE